MGSTQLPIQWVPGALSLGVERPGCEADHSPPPIVEVENAWSCTSNSHNTPSWCGAQFKRKAHGQLYLYLYLYLYHFTSCHSDIRKIQATGNILPKFSYWRLTSFCIYESSLNSMEYVLSICSNSAIHPNISCQDAKSSHYCCLLDGTFTLKCLT
jgi:hypothetical protein